jgi:hypothetical protein
LTMWASARWQWRRPTCWGAASCTHSTDCEQGAEQQAGTTT